MKIISVLLACIVTSSLLVADNTKSLNEEKNKQLRGYSNYKSIKLNSINCIEKAENLIKLNSCKDFRKVQNNAENANMLQGIKNIAIGRINKLISITDISIQCINKSSNIKEVNQCHSKWKDMIGESIGEYIPKNRKNRTKILNRMYQASKPSIGKKLNAMTTILNIVIDEKTGFYTTTYSLNKKMYMNIMNPIMEKNNLSFEDIINITIANKKTTNCAKKEYKELIKIGITIVNSYYFENGEEIFTIIVSNDICNNQ